MAEVTPTTVEELNPPKENEGSKTVDISFNADDNVTTDGKNVKQIKCDICQSTILVPGIATLVTHEFMLPDLKGEKASGEVVNKYWCVENMYAFENVGFSNTVDGVKYLVCADCEVGPIGWHDLNTKLSYVSVCKISYC
ncbi:unnamed protein product [Larinioides sclopetarius]|uniref:Guanine nucleotide exchange factor MSS4 n=1 Tax=Larinioides sclopetarius TaxID=280406 RepID=A0AAV2AVD3_9ARAC